MPARALIFDLDNTLIDTLELILSSFNAAFEPVTGKRLTLQELVSYFGPTEEWLLDKLSTPDTRTGVYERFRTHYAAGHSERMIYPGIRPMLDRLHKRGVPMVICTGKGRWTTTCTLDRLGLHPYFRATMTGDDVRRNKPHPEPVYLLCEGLGVAPSETVLIGDSLADVKAARAAGALAVLVTWGRHETRPGTDAEARSLAHVVIDRVPELERLLKTHLGD